MRAIDDVILPLQFVSRILCLIAMRIAIGEGKHCRNDDDFLHTASKIFGQSLFVFILFLHLFSPLRSFACMCVCVHAWMFWKKNNSWRKHALDFLLPRQQQQQKSSHAGMSMFFFHYLSAYSNIFFLFKEVAEFLNWWLTQIAFCT